MQISMDQEIYEFLDYEIKHGTYKRAAEFIRAKLSAPPTWLCEDCRDQWIREELGQAQ